MVKPHIDGKRNNTTPLIIEAMAFLRYNCQFLNKNTIVEAHKIVKERNIAEKVSRDAVRILENDAFVEEHPELLLFYQADLNV